jgi:hypothetical protein
MVMLNGAISSTKGQHVTRITCCDWSRTCVTGVTLMQPETHIGDVIRDWSHEYATGESIVRLIQLQVY